jgi:hypothetical protein
MLGKSLQNLVVWMIWHTGFVHPCHAVPIVFPYEVSYAAFIYCHYANVCYIVLLLLFYWRYNPLWVLAASFSRFLDHTQ